MLLLTGCGALGQSAAEAPLPALVGAPSVSESILGVLASMSEAVAVGDAPGYLAHVLMDDPVFATEQRAWAADLGRKVPQTFAMTLKEGTVEMERTPGGHANGERSGARGVLIARWSMDGGSEREVEFPARFVEVDGRWLYAGRAWETIEEDGLIVMYARGLEAPARIAAEELPAIMAHVHEGFELARDPDRVQRVKMYGSMRELQFSIYPSYVESLAGWNEPGESIKLLSSGGTSARQIRGLLAHEYGHVASFLLGEHMTGAPWWVLEGVAELSAEHVGRSYRSTDRVVRAMARRNELVAWERISDFHNVEPTLARLAYVQGHHMMGYVSERFGRSGRNAWLRRMAQGETIDEATAGAFGMTFDQLDREWRESLAGDGEQILGVP